jgi:hypothetical protein
MKVDWSEYEEAWDYYKRNWKILDDYLYRLCSEKPGHNSMGVILAKIGIIGRTYATGIERSVKVERKIENEPGQALERIADHLFENKQAVSSIFDKLEMVEQPLSLDKLSVILELYGEFSQLLREGRQTSERPLLRDNRNPRSFVSKYMHFHCPAVPVYDSVGAARIRKRYRWRKTFELCDQGEVDVEYYRFCMRFWQLYREAPENEKTVKRLDNYLLWLR